MTPEQIEELRADIAAGTKGPFRTVEGKYDETHMFLSAPSWDRFASIVVRMAGEAQNDREGEANARRIARLPTLEAEVLRLTEANAALAGEVARLRGVLETIVGIVADCPGNFLGNDADWQAARSKLMQSHARAALAHTGMTGHKENE